MLWLLTGLHTNRFKNNLERNLRCLMSGRDDIKALVVLQNGCEFEESAYIKTIQSEPGVIKFLSSGIDYLKKNSEPNDWYARIDCDDIYTSNYICEIDSIMKSDADWSCIPSNYVIVNGDVVYCERIGDDLIGLGGTLLSKINKSLDFVPQKGRESGSDTLWCERMSKIYKGLPRGPIGFALQRHENHKHVFNVPAETLIHAWPVTAYYEGRDSSLIDVQPTKKHIIENDVKKAIKIHSIFGCS